MNWSPEMGAEAEYAPLIIVAGIPSQYLYDVLLRLKSKYRQSDGHPLYLFEMLSGGKEGNKYFKQSITNCVKNVAKRIKAKNNKKTSGNMDEIKNPSNIFLLYVSPCNDEKEKMLLGSFLSFARCVKIDNPIPAGTKIDEIAKIYSDVIDKQIRRMNSSGEKNVYLPLKQFYSSKEKMLFENCLERLQATGKQAIIPKKDFPKKCCGGRCKNCKIPKGNIPQDTRELCFISADYASAHGSEYGPNYFDPCSKQAKIFGEDIAETVWLSSFYRFGFPIPVGMHFDVRYPGNKKIRANTFLCPQRGCMPETDEDYVNIFPAGMVKT